MMQIGELEQNRTIAFFATVQNEGKAEALGGDSFATWREEDCFTFDKPAAQLGKVGGAQMWQSNLLRINLFGEICQFFGLAGFYFKGWLGFREDY